MHLERFRRHGDPLGGRAPNGEPERYYREVVLAYDGNECLCWPYARNKKGYGVFRSGEGLSNIVSRRVCEEINGPPPSAEYEAAHSCGRGDQACVTKGHLSWKTCAANNADKTLHGTIIRGSQHPRSIFTEAQIREIRALRGIISGRKAAKQFGTNPTRIFMIWRREVWAWLD